MNKTPADPEATGSTESRKREHIETVLNADVAAKGVTTGFERFFFEHQALPELSLDAVDLTSTLFGKSLKAPLLISSMTGGTAQAQNINLHLAEAAQALGIAMGLGSQRAALEREDLAESYRVRRVAPDILLFANIGAVQFNYGYGLDEAKRAVDMIDADALFLHLNALQEAVQAEGDRDWSGLLGKLEKLVPAVGVPVVVKEVGNGISASVVRSLVQCGVAGIDVAGAGGTSWSEVEAHRQADPLVRTVAHSFADWGVPTALAVIEARVAAGDLPLFASGGLRSGVDVAKAVRLGATLCGTAAPVLASATETAAVVRTRMSAYIEELRIAAFCTGSRDLAALRRARLRRTDDWSVVGG
jgi:isopentenyl-diphosphate delta-isomerase